MKTAVERGMEMLHIPTKDLPPLAKEFVKKLAGEVGLCIEVCLTAYAVYAQCVEGLECDDRAYLARGEDVNWFNERIERDRQVPA